MKLDDIEGTDFGNQIILPFAIWLCLYNLASSFFGFDFLSSRPFGLKLFSYIVTIVLCSVYKWQWLIVEVCFHTAFPSSIILHYHIDIPLQLYQYCTSYCHCLLVVANSWCSWVNRVTQFSFSEGEWICGAFYMHRNTYSSKLLIIRS
jgi:hypothetical protein